MKLFNKTIDRQLFKQYSLGSDLSKQEVVVKIFNPQGAGSWYILNSDPQDPDYLWAIVDLGYGAEVGSVSRSDLETYRGRFGLGFERDLGFDPINAEELYKGLRQGKFYADGGGVDDYSDLYGQEVMALKNAKNQAKSTKYDYVVYQNAEGEISFARKNDFNRFFDKDECKILYTIDEKGNVNKIKSYANGGQISGDEVTLSKGYGYYDLSKYAYGNDFKRFTEPTVGKFIKGTVKIGGQVRVLLNDGREIITDKKAIDLPTYDDKDELYQQNKHLFSFGYADGGNLSRDRKFVNYSQDYEVKYSKGKNRKGYGFEDGGNLRQSLEELLKQDVVFLKFDSGRAYDTFNRLDIPFVNVHDYDFNHYCIIETKNLEKVLDNVRKGVRVVKKKFSSDDLGFDYKGRTSFADGGEITEEDYEKRLQYLKMMKNNERSSFGKYNIDKEIRQINTILEHRKNFKNSYADGGEVKDLIRERNELLNDMYNNEDTEVESSDIVKVGDVLYGDGVNGYVRIVKEVNDPLKGDYFILQDKFDDKFAFYITQIIRDLYKKELKIQNVNVSEKDFLYSNEVVNIKKELEFHKGRVNLYKKNPNDASNYSGISYSDYVGSESKIKKLKEDLKLYLKDEKHNFADGGNIENFSDNQQMIMNQNVEVEHHHEELEDILEDKVPVPAWVVAKMETATKNLSDITHYLDGQKELMEDEKEEDDEDDEEDEEYGEFDYSNLDDDEDEMESREIKNKEVVEPINVTAETKAELTKKFTDDALGNLKGFLKGMEEIELRDDYTFDYKNEQFEIEPIINSDQNGVSNAVFTIFDGDGEEVGEVAYSREGGKQKFTANSQFFGWDRAKFEDGGFMNGVYAKGGIVDVEKVNKADEIYREHNRERKEKGIENFSKESVALWNEKYDNRLQKLKLTFEEKNALNPKKWYADGGYFDGTIPKVSTFMNTYAKGGEIAKAEVFGLKRNIMGTTDIEMRISGMRKAQDFIVYPIGADDAGNVITIQSETRIGQINLVKGVGVMSQSHSNGAYFMHLQMDKLTPFTISESDLENIKSHIFKTAGANVGSSVVKSDNSGASRLFADGGNFEKPFDVVYKTKSGRAMVAKRIMAKDEDEAKEKIEKQMRNSNTFEKVFMSYPSFADGGVLYANQYFGKGYENEAIIELKKALPNHTFEKGKNSIVVDNGKFIIHLDLGNYGFIKAYSKEGSEGGISVTKISDAVDFIKDNQNFSFADGGFMNNVYADGGQIRVGDRYKFYWTDTEGNKGYTIREVVKQNVTSGKDFRTKVMIMKVVESSMPETVGRMEEEYKPSFKKAIERGMEISMQEGKPRMADDDYATGGSLSEIEISKSGKLKTNGEVEESWYNTFAEGIVNKNGEEVGVKMNDINKGIVYYQALAKDTPENREGYGWEEHNDEVGFIYKKFATIDDLERFVNKTKDKPKYILKADIKTVTVKRNGKEVTYEGADVLNGANVLAKGGDLTSKANYVAKRDVVSVELKDGTTIKPVNGYWVKKGAEPIGAEPTPTSSAKSPSKVGQTYIKKGVYGWSATTNIDDFNDYDWRISTIKTSSGQLITSAKAGKNEQGDGYTTFKYTMYQDPYHTLEVSKPSRLTEKVVAEQHAKGVEKFKKFMETGMFKGGGKISNFDKLSAKVAKQYEGKPVKNQYQEEYGKYYSREEAQEVGDKVAGKVKAMQTDKKAFGGLFKNVKDLAKAKPKYPNLEGKQVPLKSGEFVMVFTQDDNTLSVMNVGKIGSGVKLRNIDISEVDMTNFKAGGQTGTKKMNAGTETMKQANDLAKKIRMDGESWLDAKKRAFAELRKQNEAKNN